jgi:hypothetical protein
MSKILLVEHYYDLISTPFQNQFKEPKIITKDNQHLVYPPWDKYVERKPLYFISGFGFMCYEESLDEWDTFVIHAKTPIFEHNNNFHILEPLIEKIKKDHFYLVLFSYSKPNLDSLRNRIESNTHNDSYKGQIQTLEYLSLDSLFEFMDDINTRIEAILNL